LAGENFTTKALVAAMLPELLFDTARQAETAMEILLNLAALPDSSTLNADDPRSTPISHEAAGAIRRVLDQLYRTVKTADLKKEVAEKLADKPAFHPAKTGRPIEPGLLEFTLAPLALFEKTVHGILAEIDGAEKEDGATPAELEKFRAMAIGLYNDNRAMREALARALPWFDSITFNGKPVPRMVAWCIIRPMKESEYQRIVLAYLKAEFMKNPKRARALLDSPKEKRMRNFTDYRERVATAVHECINRSIFGPVPFHEAKHHQKTGPR
jgi:hypothetical protein